MYDPFFAKSFSRYDRKRFGWFALLLSFLITLTIFYSNDPTLHPFTNISDTVPVSLRLSINAIQDLLVDDITVQPFETSKEKQTSDVELDNTMNLQLSEEGAQNISIINSNAADAETELLLAQENKTNPQSSNDAAQSNNTDATTELKGAQNIMLPQEDKAEPLNPHSSNDAARNNNTVSVIELEGAQNIMLPQEDKAEPLNPQSSNDAAQNNNTDAMRELKGAQNIMLPQEDKAEPLNPHSSNDAARNNNTDAMRELKVPQEDKAEPLNPQSSNDAAQNNNTVAVIELKGAQNIMLPQKNKAEPLAPHSSNDAAQNNTATMIELKGARNIMLPQENKTDPSNLQSSNDQIHQKQEEQEPLCRVLKADADYCEIEGDVRVDSNSSTVFLIRPGSGSTFTTSWTIQPYPRRGIAFVKHWTVRVAAADNNSIPKCTQNHPHPAILFSIGGFTGNHFHDFADVLFPLFTTSFHYQRNAHFLVSDNKPWWLIKYQPLLHQLSRHNILDANHETHNIHCYNKLTAGLRFHRELLDYPTSGSEASMIQFRNLLRRTYSLDRNTATKPPRLMIVSRKRSRILINEDEISEAARDLGYEVVSAESDVSSNLTKVAQLVNSCDVMMGIHGAGLTNMVFLPEKAVLIQVVPLGAIDVFAKLDFADPSAGMNISYLEYKIGLNESSLLQRYPADHPVIKDPLSIHRQGWGKLRDVYLHNQNVTIDVARFRPILAESLRLLPS